MKKNINLITFPICKKIKPLNPTDNILLSFTEIGKLADRWLDEELAKEPKDNYTNREKYLMIESFIEGYKKSMMNNIETTLKRKKYFLGLRFIFWKVVQGYRLSIDTKTTR